MEDIAYLNITPTSSEQEKMNAVFDFLSKSNNGYSLLYDRLFIPDGKEILFDKKLLDTKFVRTSSGKTGFPFFHFTEEGKIMLAQYGNFLNYHKIQTAQNQKLQSVIEERENLDLENLRSQNALLLSQLVDFPKIKSNRNALFIIAMIELLVIIAGIILQLKGKS